MFEEFSSRWAASRPRRKAQLKILGPAPAGLILASPDWSDYRIYPDAAVAKQQEGRIIPELLIGSDGTSQSLSYRGLQQVRRARCRNVRLDDENAVRTGTQRLPAAVPIHYERAVIWGLTDPQPFASSAIRARVTIAAGKAQSCQVSAVKALRCFLVSIRLHCSRISLLFCRTQPGLPEALIEVRLDAGDDPPSSKHPGAREASSPMRKSGSQSTAREPQRAAPLKIGGFGRHGYSLAARAIAVGLVVC